MGAIAPRSNSSSAMLSRKLGQFSSSFSFSFRSSILLSQTRHHPSQRLSRTRLNHSADSVSWSLSLKYFFWSSEWSALEKSVRRLRSTMCTKSIRNGTSAQAVSRSPTYASTSGSSIGTVRWNAMGTAISAASSGSISSR